MNTRLFFAVSIVWCVSVSNGQADTIHLRDGSSVEGEVLSEEGGVYSVRKTDGKSIWFTEYSKRDVLLIEKSQQKIDERKSLLKQTDVLLEELASTQEQLELLKEENDSLTKKVKALEEEKLAIQKERKAFLQAIKNAAAASSQRN